MSENMLSDLAENRTLEEKSEEELEVRAPVQSMIQSEGVSKSGNNSPISGLHATLIGIRIDDSNNSAGQHSLNHHTVNLLGTKTTSLAFRVNSNTHDLARIAAKVKDLEALVKELFGTRLEAPSACEQPTSQTHHRNKKPRLFDSASIGEERNSTLEREQRLECSHNSLFGVEEESDGSKIFREDIKPHNQKSDLRRSLKIFPQKLPGHPFGHPATEHDRNPSDRALNPTGDRMAYQVYVSQQPAFKSTTSNLSKGFSFMQDRHLSRSGALVGDRAKPAEGQAEEYHSNDIDSSKVENWFGKG